MKTYIKSYLILALFMVGLASQVSAQSKRNTRQPETVSKTTSKKSPSGIKTTKRVPSSRVVYKKPSRKVVSVRTLPKKSVVRYNNQNYYYADNRFYTQSRGRYIVIAPKVGFRIKTLPARYRVVRFNNHMYYHAYGVFYIQVNNEYEVVDPEVGTIVYELPDDYEKVSIDGQTYYEYANVLYEKIQVDGTRAYEVVGIIEME